MIRRYDNLGKVNTILNVIFTGNGQFLENALSSSANNSYFGLLINDFVYLNAVANSQTAMNAVANSQTAMNAVANSQTAMNAVINSQTAMNAVANSQTAMNAVANSQTAMNAVINSQTAMNAVANSQTAMNAVANSQTAMNAVANSQTAMNAVINSQTALNAVKNNSTAWTTFKNSTALTTKSVPTMTSNADPEGVCSASSIVNSTYDAFKAFDKVTNTFWGAASAPPQWIQYQFTSNVFVHTVSAKGYGVAGNNYNPTAIVIQASSNGTDFIDILTYNQEITINGVTLEIAKQGYYRYWRIRITSTVGNAAPYCAEINFAGFVQPV